MRKFIEPIIIAMLLLAGFAGMAFAAGAPTSPDDQSLIELMRPVLDAVMHGQWWIAAAAGLVLSVAAMRRYSDKLGRFGKAVKTEPGIIATTFVLSFAGAALTALTAAGPGAVVSSALAMMSAKIAFAAVGGWMIIHKVATWAVATEFYKTKVPAWIQSIIGGALALIGSNAVKKAEDAGNAAVAANPATGATNGDFTKF